MGSDSVISEPSSARADSSAPSAFWLSAFSSSRYSSENQVLQMGCESVLQSLPLPTVRVSRHNQILAGTQLSSILPINSSHHAVCPLFSFYPVPLQKRPYRLLLSRRLSFSRARCRNRSFGFSPDLLPEPVYSLLLGLPLLRSWPFLLKKHRDLREFLQQQKTPWTVLPLRTPPDCLSQALSPLGLTPELRSYLTGLGGIVGI